MMKTDASNLTAILLTNSTLGACFPAVPHMEYDASAVIGVTYGKVW